MKVEYSCSLIVLGRGSSDFSSICLVVCTARYATPLPLGCFGDDVICLNGTLGTGTISSGSQFSRALILHSVHSLMRFSMYLVIPNQNTVFLALAIHFDIP